MIISGGINERVERILTGHPAIDDVAIVGTPHETWGEAVKAHLVPEDAGIAAADLDKWCRESDDLADYQRPRECEFVEQLPRNDPGKLDRAALRTVSETPSRVRIFDV